MLKYFKYLVAIVLSSSIIFASGWHTADEILGGNFTGSRYNFSNQVCIGDVCRSDWPTVSGGSSLWSEGTGGNINYNGGNVGIGITNPDKYFVVQADDSSNFIGEFRNTGTGTANNGLVVSSASTSNNVMALVVQNSLYVKGDGNVGIGYTDPGSSKLAINGDTFVDGVLRVGGINSIYFNNASGDVAGVVMSGGDMKIGDFFGAAPNSADVIFYTADLERMRISSDGSVKIGDTEIGTWPADSGYAYFGHKDLDHSVAGNYAILQESDGETYVNTAGGKNLLFRENNANKMIMSPGGNLWMEGDLDLDGGKAEFNEILFRNLDGGDDSDPYRLRKEQLGANSNQLVLYLNDDSDEQFTIKGYSCESHSCSEYGGNNKHYFKSDGTAYHAGSVYGSAFYYNSDELLKKDILRIDSSLDKIKKLEGVSFKWKKNNESDIGFIAQEVEKVVPELVTTNKDTGLKSVKYGNINALLVEAVKEQDETINYLKEEINLLKKEIEKIKDEN
jgi:hypothetical protein